MTTRREFARGVHIECEHGHRISANREPVEHGIVECRHSNVRTYPAHTAIPCGELLWVLQLDGGRRLAVTITVPIAKRIRAARMSAADVLDILGLLTV